MAKTPLLLLLGVICAGFVAGCTDAGANDYGGEVSQVDAEKQKNFKGRFGEGGGAANPNGKPDASAVSVDR